MATTQQTYGLDVTLSLPFDTTVERTKAALKAEGFGVLTEIDVQETLKQKIGAEFERYLILGACNPHLAYRALQVEHDLGLLLPCNVIVHDHDGGTKVSIVDPAAMLGMVANPALTAVADEARQRLQRVVAALRAQEEA
jgi:uncharacterized protein (DUF302 family)